MTKKQLAALILIAISVIILIFNVGGRVDVNLLYDTVRPMRALVYFAFISVGVAIGVLLK
jgi:hypothetical protein